VHVTYKYTPRAKRRNISMLKQVVHIVTTQIYKSLPTLQRRLLHGANLTTLSSLYLKYHDYSQVI
jgi:hypothetical protein